MIARVWRGYTTIGNAEAYEAMLTPELLPGLSRQRGFRGSYLLRRTLGDEVEFITIILWESLEDVKAMAGDDYTTAIVPAERRRLLTRWDATAAHYVVSAVQATPASLPEESR
jgi:heme-degrading monooxygenase HmoA